MRLSDIQALKPGETLYDKGDRASVKGLQIRAMPSGAKDYYLYYRTKARRQRRPKLGSVTEITLGEARRMAREMLTRVAVGEDPQAQSSALRAEMLAGELFTAVLERYWKAEKFKESERAKQVQNFWKNNLERTFAKLKLSEITSPIIREWHLCLQHKPYAANRSLEVLSKMFSFAEEYGIRTPGSNPCSVVSAHKESKRKRFATEEEIRKLADLLELEKEDNPRGVAFLYLLIYSGSRPSAIANAKWSDLQLYEKPSGTYGLLTLRGKTTAETGEDEIVVLPPQAVSIVLSLPRTTDPRILGLSYLPVKLWARVRKKAGCEDLRARDLRRTFATVGLSNGVDIGVIGELLNHRSTQTTKIYARLMQDKKMEAAAQIADQVQRIMTK